MALKEYEIENIFNFPYLSAKYPIGSDDIIPVIADEVNPIPITLGDT